LVVGDIIQAKILAFNNYGNSGTSPIGGSGKMVQVPDQPVNLADNPAITSSRNISFTWNAGPSDGGEVVIDYAIFYEQATNVWQPLAVNYK
jgi:hypothetical protein